MKAARRASAQGWLRPEGEPACPSVPETSGASGVQSRAVSTPEPLDRLFRRVLDTHADDYDPWLYRYCGRLANSDEGGSLSRASRRTA
jgi:hypothetical protein